MGRTEAPLIPVGSHSRGWDLNSGRRHGGDAFLFAGDHSARPVSLTNSTYRHVVMW